MKIEVYTIEEYTRKYDPYENDPFVMEQFVRVVGRNAVIFFRSYGQSESSMNLSDYRILVITDKKEPYMVASKKYFKPKIDAFLKRRELLDISYIRFHNDKWYLFAQKEKAARSE